MRIGDRDAKAAPLLHARPEALQGFDIITTGDEYGTEWEVVAVTDAGSVLTCQTITVDGEESAATIMDELQLGWDEGLITT